MFLPGSLGHRCAGSQSQQARADGPHGLRRRANHAGERGFPRRGTRKVPWRTLCFVYVVISQREFTPLPVRCDVLDAIARNDGELGTATAIIKLRPLIAPTTDRSLETADGLVAAGRNSARTSTAELEG